jgi:hypothetical protein
MMNQDQSNAIMHYQNYNASPAEQNDPIMHDGFSINRDTPCTSVDEFFNEYLSSENLFQCSSSYNDSLLSYDDAENLTYSQPDMLKSHLPAIFDDKNTIPCEPHNVGTPLVSMEDQVQESNINKNNDTTQYDERTFDLLLKFSENYWASNYHVNS